MIELYTADTPNGWKISIMLEETGLDYKTIQVSLDGDQFKPEFKKISPFNKIPVIVDKENNKSIFESGAILMYWLNLEFMLLKQKNKKLQNTLKE